MTFQVNGKQKVTFIHIPKTAGTSITEWFRLICTYPPNGYEMTKFCETREHWGINELRKTQSDLGWTFAVVRNPWDYAVSLYHHLVQKMPIAYPKLQWLEDVTFDDWISDIDNYPKTFVEPYKLSSPQVSWIDETVYVLRYEYLERDFKVVQNVMGHHLPLPVRNVSSRTAYKDYYNDTTRKLVAKIFEEDIERFKCVF